MYVRVTAIESIGFPVVSPIAKIEWFQFSKPLIVFPLPHCLPEKVLPSRVISHDPQLQLSSVQRGVYMLVGSGSFCSILSTKKSKCVSFAAEFYSLISFKLNYILM